ncbi:MULTISPECIES: lysophospholipid acyltransferase family protein [unclassified Microbacterium]|uniref:lysophospholipid acyltransferase family protein n=1 Tax=unclassified Microbacterium TaxID=2609290 RepID=UPI00097EB59D|nr:lysophospholipid acyltransferase family protein [Microbacterium sp. JB110]RCS57759.1 1-acyl-sn-glycerol-3-phosphate acyltransferase [Microbacterium sp. JB110]SJM67870.1 1-acyl-sn-glycerol-3-phosphate acyltransferase [Frigoribacterium sp. JB110]
MTSSGSHEEGDDPTGLPESAPHRPSWLYTFGRTVIAPLARMIYRPRVEGKENLPKHGAVILASNHLSVIDSFAIPIAAAPRAVHFLAKSDYFTGKGLTGWLSRTFFTSVGAVPVDRGAGQAALDALEQQRRILETGAAVALHPEGTRSRDGRLYKGRTGIAFLALQTGAPVVPIGLVGTDRVMPVGAKMPKLSERVVVRFGAPIDVSTHGPATSGKARRHATDEIMAAIHELSGQELAGTYNELPAQGPVQKLKRVLPHERR